MSDARPEPTTTTPALQDLLTSLGADPATGLSEEQARARKQRRSKRVSGILSAARLSALAAGWGLGPEVLSLFAIAFACALRGDTLTGYMMASVILLAQGAAAVSYRLDARTRAAVRPLVDPAAMLRRAGKVRRVAARELVPGDIILLVSGSVIPADCRIVSHVGLRLVPPPAAAPAPPTQDEADGDPAAVFTPGSDSLIPCGHVVLSGWAEAVCVSPGRGQVAQEIPRCDPGVELLRPSLRPELLVRAGATAACLAIAATLLAERLWPGFSSADTDRLFGLAATLIPLPLSYLSSLSNLIATRRLLRRHVVLRDGGALERLAAVTAVCVPMTGVLTQARLSVAAAYLGGKVVTMETLRGHKPAGDDEGEATRQDSGSPDPLVRLLFAGAALCNDAVLSRVGPHSDRAQAIGDPTDLALIEAAARIGLSKSTLEEVFPRVSEIPLRASRRRATTIHRGVLSRPPAAHWLRGLWNGTPPRPETHWLALSKGAAETLISLSSSAVGSHGVEIMTPDLRVRSLAAADRFAAEGLRVIAVGCRILTSAPPTGVDITDGDLIFVGLIALSDPPRPDAPRAVTELSDLGVDVILVTGEHPGTALAVDALARDPGETGTVTTGGQLDAGPDLGCEPEQAAAHAVYARMEPRHKHLILEQLRQRGEVVAVISGALADRPVLAAAPVSVALGTTGTDAARQVADVVLLDDSIGSLGAALAIAQASAAARWRSEQHLLSSAVALLILLALGPLVPLFPRLSPLHIIWLALISSALPGLALLGDEVQPPAHTRRRPGPERLRHSSFISTVLRKSAGLLFAVTVALAPWSRSAHGPQLAAIALITLSWTQAGVVFLRPPAHRSPRFPVLAHTRLLLAVVAASVSLPLLLTFVPPLAASFRLAPVTPAQLAWTAAVSLAVSGFAAFGAWRERRASGAV
ncbi:MAG: cation-transporting P-type ATPase [Candidatus Schekmanbacteria bacterium]|nr:cation-transporting P-type ATPase [Candidatus Schekmanbacteria bacterium]